MQAILGSIQALHGKVGNKLLDFEEGAPGLFCGGYILEQRGEKFVQCHDRVLHTANVPPMRGAFLSHRTNKSQQSRIIIAFQPFHHAAQYPARNTHPGLRRQCSVIRMFLQSLLVFEQQSVELNTERGCQFLHVTGLPL